MLVTLRFCDRLELGTGLPEPEGPPGPPEPPDGGVEGLGEDIVAGGRLNLGGVLFLGGVRLPNTLLYCSRPNLQ